MYLTIQIIANDKTVGSETVHDLKEFNNQTLATRAKKGEQLVCTMPAITKTFDLLGDDIVELSAEIEALKNQKVENYEKRLEESKAKLLK